MIQSQRKKNYDIVAGTRFNPDGGVCGWNFVRKLFSGIANAIALALLGTNTSDLTDSFRYAVVAFLYTIKLLLSILIVYTALPF